jgi:hypothetical protein
MNIFLDDERLPANYLDFVIVRNYNEFVDAVLYAKTPIKFISFDHDLGDDSLSGYECAKYLVDLDEDRGGTLIGPDFEWYVHSQNPVGAANIENYLDGYMNFKYQTEADY